MIIFRGQDKRYCLDVDGGQLLRGTERIHLPRKEWDVLLYLAQRPERLVPKRQLLDEVWGRDVNVTEGVLDKTISKLRSALGDSTRTPLFIETFHGRGYRFVAAIEEPGSAPQRDPVQQTVPTDVAPLVPPQSEPRAVVPAPTDVTPPSVLPTDVEEEIESAEAYEAIGDVWSAYPIYASAAQKLKAAGKLELSEEMMRRMKKNRSAAAAANRGDW